ncbi:helix-turn-helix transcriptional regulator [uncultured Sulfitobacter sp.]|uniref:helix-turn-helix transcriptional regulator n=1 Tax=uncultured Sulfitobacter sp. TaxID=191468 RepID=UPI00261983FD|nr:helix-turn-helix transcriptional regulator [uncultured Sulfitobacter sp.]
MNLRERVAKNIIDYRKSVGLSQENLAKRSGVSRSHLGKIENARYSMNIDTIEKIARALDVEADVLFEPR